MHHVLQKSYFSKKKVLGFLKRLAANEEITSGNPKRFWKQATILNIQRGGSSQKEMLQTFDPILKEQYGYGVGDCEKESETAIYIDDVVFSGGHVRGDLINWIVERAPKSVQIHIIALALYEGGRYYAQEKILEAATNAKKSVKLRWWRIHELEDRKISINASDVLRPTRIPDDKATIRYAEQLKAEGYPPVLRKPGSVGPAKIFSSEENRDLLEQQFLIKGVEIREKCPYLNKHQHPLGNTVLRMLGFGATAVTFRNCANNCPLAIWAGDPWIPLFPRKISQ